MPLLGLALRELQRRADRGKLARSRLESTGDDVALAATVRRLRRRGDERVRLGVEHVCTESKVGSRLGAVSP